MKVFDCHCHTEFAYCGSGIVAADAVGQCRARGLAGVCIVEHAPQLYCRADDFWHARHIREPETWRVKDHSRMKQFQKAMEPLRDGYVRLGLEVELDHAGDLTVLPDDRAWADVLLGAIHWLPGAQREMSPEQWDERFVSACEAILAGDVDILAHPFRVYSSVERTPPHDVVTQIVSMLAETGTAAELNLHHTSVPDVSFLRACIDRGVRIALGSDAHETRNAGDLHEHLRILSEALPDRMPENVLYEPPAGKTIAE